MGSHKSATFGIAIAFEVRSHKSATFGTRYSNIYGLVFSHMAGLRNLSHSSRMFQVSFFPTYQSPAVLQIRASAIGWLLKPFALCLNRFVSYCLHLSVVTCDYATSWIFKPYWSHNQTISKAYSSHMQPTFKPYSNHIQTICKLFARTFKPHASHIQAVSKPY